VDELLIFKELGFPALAFGAMWVMSKSLIAELRTMNEASDKRINEQANRHNEERKEWRIAIDRLSETLNKLYDKPCQTNGRLRTGDRKHEAL
jgi:hypothetical protein